MATRRRFLIGTAAATTGLTAVAGSASAQAQTFQLDLTQDGFVGQSPSSIQGQTNPTLEVEAGNRYTIEVTVRWIPQMSGLPGRHNLIIRTESGTLRRSNYRFDTGTTISTTFEATGDLTTYGCEEHMGESGEFNVTGVETPTPTSTPMDGGDGDGGDMTSTPMDGGGDMTPTEGGGGGGESGGGAPGFGVGAALAALGAGAYGAMKRSDD